MEAYLFRAVFFCKATKSRIHFLVALRKNDLDYATCIAPTMAPAPSGYEFEHVVPQGICNKVFIE